jgi:hypothetical protein
MTAEESLRSPLLPGFAVTVGELMPPPSGKATTAARTALPAERAVR